MIQRYILQVIVRVVGKELAKELKQACLVDSILRSRDPKTIESFTWNKLLTKLQSTCPLTLALLKNCTTSFRSAKAKRGPQSVNTDMVVAMCCSILLRARTRGMNIVQRLVSVLLYGGHASKQVYLRAIFFHVPLNYFVLNMQTYTRLQKLMLCMSHKATISFVDKLGENFDSEVK